MISFVQKTNGTLDMVYTVGDTFKFVLLAEDVVDESVSSIRLQISENGRSDNVYFSKNFIASNNETTVELSMEELTPFVSGSEYVYRLTLFKADGDIITTISGNFIVKWGV